MEEGSHFRRGGTSHVCESVLSLSIRRKNSEVHGTAMKMGDIHEKSVDVSLRGRGRAKTLWFCTGRRSNPNGERGKGGALSFRGGKREEKGLAAVQLREAGPSRQN